MPSVLDVHDRARLLERIRRLDPQAPARWGRMNASQMITHLGDQMRITLGDLRATPRRSPIRLPVVKDVVMFWLPWPKGRIKGPPEAFTTRPTDWQADLATLTTLVERFVSESGRAEYPDHPMFGRLSREHWGRFTFRHFDHHLRQFGV